MEKIIFRVLDSFNAKLVKEIKKLEVQNLGAQAAINQWQIPVIIRYGKFIVAQDDKGRIVGACELLRKWKENDSAFLHSFYISKEYRSKGTGRRLLEFVLECLRSGNFKSVSLTVAPDNIAAVRLYSGAGFKIKEVLRNEYGPETDRYLMEKEL
jgi:ribosomal-protein-alanine N-acetyltransferase